jgi:gas vesicle protein
VTEREWQSQVGSFLAGLGIGLAIGLPFAPRAGAEMREYLKERAGEGGEFLRRQAEELRRGAGQLRERAKEYTA